MSNYLCPSVAQPSRIVAPGDVGWGFIDYAATTARTWPNSFVNAAQAATAEYSRVESGTNQHFGALGLKNTNINTPASLLTEKRTLVGLVDGTSNTMLVAECGGRRRGYRMGQPDAALDSPLNESCWASSTNRLNISG